ncbi:hypothetical protein D3C87_1967660 [compost metagenome]
MLAVRLTSRLLEQEVIHRVRPLWERRDVQVVAVVRPQVALQALERRVGIRGVPRHAPGQRSGSRREALGHLEVGPQQALLA